MFFFAHSSLLYLYFSVLFRSPHFFVVLCARHRAWIFVGASYNTHTKSANPIPMYVSSTSHQDREANMKENQKIICRARACVCVRKIYLFFVCMYICWSVYGIEKMLRLLYRVVHILACILLLLLLLLLATFACMYVVRMCVCACSIRLSYFLAFVLDTIRRHFCDFFCLFSCCSFFSLCG